MEEKLSPMMVHYRQLKESYNDAIVLYRLGDFYEMFFEDAVTASRVLDLTLTGRDCGLSERAPMCGVPYHAVDGYIAKLIEAGFNVAICDQLTQPGDQKGMVKRDVTRVITPGTVIEDELLDVKRNNYIASVYLTKNGYGLAFLDISNGEINAYSKQGLDVLPNLENYLQVLTPNEIIGNSTFVDIARDFSSVTAQKLRKPKSFYDYSFDFDNASNKIKTQMGVFSLTALGLSDCKLEVSAIGGLLDYILSTQKRELVHLNRIKLLNDKSYMLLDYNTKRNLELVENLGDHTKTGSLLWVLDATNTNMGARLLRRWVEEPLLSETEINRRLDAVAELVHSQRLRNEIKKNTSHIRDLERLAGKISYGSLTPRECLALSETLTNVPMLKTAIKDAKSEYLTDIERTLDPLPEVADLLTRAIAEDAPPTMKDGGMIKRGYNQALDQLKSARDSGNGWMREFEAKEREATGIKTLKVGYNRVFGYYIEVTNSQTNLVPYNYVRKQTLANAERYITEELKQVEDTLLGASEKALALELELFDEIRQGLKGVIKALQSTGEAVARLDAIYSLASVAVAHNYVRPKVNAKGQIKIVDGRHPVVEAFKKQNEFVPNDCTLDKETNTLIITGPNMAGKSTYMRQVALIALMAQIGSFVPAKQAEIGIVDRIYTRIGASDNLSQGQSTFMVEMIEVANILSSATKDSLLVLDEIGRGTSTLDGLSIAWAIVEYIATKIHAKTLFATHYHELSQIEGILPGIKNYRILINDVGGKISFLYKIARGGASQSFGIEVAGLAGINKVVISRAKAIMKSLESSHEVSGDLIDKLSQAPSETSVATTQIGFFEEDKRLVAIQRVLRDVDLNRCTPIEALTILSDIKKIFEKD